MSEPWIRIELEADTDGPFVAMFEPSGMTYELSRGQRMSADVFVPISNTLRVVYWTGGVSVWAPGAVITRDSDGNELHRLN